MQPRTTSNSLGHRTLMKNMVSGVSVQGTSGSSVPLAELYTDVTILFVDVVGFTAWASVRQPPRVFTLLEQVYQSFDMIARQRRVFKVETTGDCYVAVTGFPDKQRDHTFRMCQFTGQCLRAFLPCSQ